MDNISISPEDVSDDELKAIFGENHSDSGLASPVCTSEKRYRLCYGLSTYEIVYLKLFNLDLKFWIVL